MTNGSSDTYRQKAFSCERLAKAATTYEAKCEWVDLGIEWHALASRIALESSNCELEV